MHACAFLSEEHLISGSNDTKVIVWDTDSGRPLIKYDDHITPVSSIDVCGLDGNVFASGSEDCFKVWDIRMNKACFRVFDLHNPNNVGYSAIKFMPENMCTLATGQEDGNVKVWDLRALAPVAQVSHELEDYSGCTSLAFSNSGRVLFTSYKNEIIRPWDILREKEAGNRFGETQAHTKDI